MRPEKQFLFNEIADHIEEYGNFIIGEYQGQAANDTANFRSKLKSIGAEMEVVRKRILIKVLQERGVDLDLSSLSGHICLVFAPEDGVETAKCLTNAEKEGLRSAIVGGYFDGKLLDAAQVKVYATLPGKDEMRAQLLATLSAPLSQTVSAMNALLTSVPHCLNNKASQ